MDEDEEVEEGEEGEYIAGSLWDVTKVAAMFGRRRSSSRSSSRSSRSSRGQREHEWEQFVSLLPVRPSVSQSRHRIHPDGSNIHPALKSGIQ